MWAQNVLIAELHRQGALDLRGLLDATNRALSTLPAEKHLSGEAQALMWWQKKFQEVLDGRLDPRERPDWFRGVIDGGKPEGPRSSKIHDPGDDDGT
jgi:hypothetical protein